MKWYIALAGLLLSFSANSAVVTSDESAGTPLTTGSSYAFSESIGGSTPFVHSIHFSTDELAASSSLATIGLELTGVSSFVGTLTLSLYEGVFVTTDDTTGGTLLASSTGSHLNNIGVSANQTYSFIIEGLTGNTPVNILTGAVAVSDVAPVPVPAAAWLFGSALMGLAMLKRKKS